MRTMGLRAAMAVVAVALGTTAFAGTALASDHGAHVSGHRHHTHGDGGNGGTGGGANANCLVPVGLSAGILGQGGSNSQCNAKAGEAGSGGDGISH